MFLPFHHRAQRWALLVAHRRAGKTVAALNDQVSRALYFDTLVEPRFAYIAPFYSQAKRIAWSYLRRYAGAAASKVYESELTIKIRHNGALISLFGADNPDSFRGQYFDGVVLDEYGNMKPSIWSEVLLPTLLDRRGWATFIGTPNGPNHFRDLYHEALKSPERWFVDILPVSSTGLIPEEELDEMRRLMLPEEYEQEMECSFEASTRGAFYAAETKKATAEGRLGLFPADPTLPLHFVFDIGFRDDCAMGAFQERPDGVTLVEAHAENMRAAPYWIDRINQTCIQHNCSRGQVWLPHDAAAKTYATGISTIEQFVAAGIRPRPVPNLDKQDGISAARYIFQYMWFNEPLTDKFWLALKSYHRTWDEDKKAFTNGDVHDWSSHYADMFRYLALSARFPTARRNSSDIIILKEPTDLIVPVSHPFSLNDLWEAQRGRSDRIQ